MGRRKMEKKRIEDKNSRHAAFSKRRAGLNKKARQLSELCDADVAVVVFSSAGNLYEYCSGNTDRYQKSCPQKEERTTEEGTSQDMGINNMCTRFRTCNELRLSARRLDEEGNKASVNDMTELEEELTAALMHTRARKTQLMMERLSTLHEQERKLTMEKEQLEQQVAAAAATEKDDDDDDGGGDIATSDSYTSPRTQELVTLPLFKD